MVLTDASDFVDERIVGGNFRGAKCKMRIAHKVTSWGYTRQTPIGRPMPSKNRDWSKVVGSPHLPPIQPDLPRELAS